MAITLTMTLRIAGKRARKSSPGFRQYQRVYQGITDADATEGDVEALTGTATGEHVELGDAHPSNPSALCTNIEVQSADDSRRVFTITADFEEPTGGGTIPGNPLLRPADVRWGSEVEQRPILLDFSPIPRAITNSAGERFPELPVRDFGEQTVEWTRNELNPDMWLQRQAMFVVNDADFTIDGRVIPRGKALLWIDSSIKTYEGQFTYYRVTYRIRFKDEGWLPTRILDVGYNQIDWTTPPFDLEPITNADNLEVKTPYPLDGIGQAMPNPTDPPFELPYNYYREFNFGVFNFV